VCAPCIALHPYALARPRLWASRPPHQSKKQHEGSSRVQPRDFQWKLALCKKRKIKLVYTSTGLVLTQRYDITQRCCTCVYMYCCCISVVKTDLQLPNLTTAIRHVLLIIQAIVNSYVRFSCEDSVFALGVIARAGERGSRAGSTRRFSVAGCRNPFLQLSLACYPLQNYDAGWSQHRMNLKYHAYIVTLSLPSLFAASTFLGSHNVCILHSIFGTWCS